MPIYVKRHEWDWPGAPVLGGNSPGSLVALLDAVLVTGWGQKNVGSITRVDDVATVFVSTGHEKVVGQCVLHEGWDQAAYNGDFEVTEVVDANTYRVKVSGTPATPGTAGGTPTTKVSPLGWQKPFAATNKGAYRSSVTVGCTRHYLYVDDSYDAYQAAVMGYETMSAIGVGTGAFPLKGGDTDSSWTPHYRWTKHNNPAQTSTRPKNAWTLIGDAKRFYLLVDWESTYTTGGFRHVLYGFGDFVSMGGESDLHRSFLMGCKNSSVPTMGSDVGVLGQRNGSAAYNNGFTRSHLGRAVCRGWDKQPNGADFAFLTLAALSGSSTFVSGADTGSGGMSWPSPFRQKTVLAQTFVVDSAKASFLNGGSRSVRGILPGVHAFMHSTILSDGYTFVGAPGFEQRKFVTKSGVGASGLREGGWAFDLTGPWE